MKKIFLLIVVLLQIGFLFAQERDNVGHSVGSWNMSSHNCFKGLSWKIRKSYYSDNSDQYTNEIEIKNNYGSTVTFSYNMSDNANETTTRYRKTLTPGQTYNSTYCPNVNLVTFYVTDVCFNNNNCKDGCYGLCDNGTPNQPNCGSNSNSNTSSSTNSTYANNKITTTNNTSNSSSAQTNKTQPNQVINTQPNNTNTEILNVLESTMNQVANSITNSHANPSNSWIEFLKENELKIKTVQEEFAVKSLSDKEIDSLLDNPSPNNYASINIYNKNNLNYYVIINGKKLPLVDNKNEKLEYRIYDGTKLVIQAYRHNNYEAYMPIQSITIRVKKGKEYYFIIKKLNMIQLTLEQIDEKPLNKKGEELYKSINQNIKSDIDY